MKTLELNLPTAVLLVWGLPEATDFDAPFEAIEHKGGCYLVYSQHSGHIITRDLLPDGNWQLIGKLTELTEEQAQTIVFRSRIGKYKDYKPTTVSKETDPIGLINALLEMSKDTALQSFHSAIEAEGYYVENPIPKPTPCGCMGPCGLVCPSEMWQDAQSKTLPANTLIFKRV